MFSYFIKWLRPSSLAKSNSSNQIGEENIEMSPPFFSLKVFYTESPVLTPNPKMGLLSVVTGPLLKRVLPCSLTLNSLRASGSMRFTRQSTFTTGLSLLCCITSLPLRVFMAKSLITNSLRLLGASVILFCALTPPTNWSFGHPLAFSLATAPNTKGTCAFMFPQIESMSLVMSCLMKPPSHTRLIQPFTPPHHPPTRVSPP